MRPSSFTFGFLVVALLAVSAGAEAQNMNIALSRLRIQGVDPAVDPTTACPLTAGRSVCADTNAYRSVMTQFSGSLIPPILTPAGTRGVRGIYVGFETWLTGIDHSQEYWHRAVEGDGGSMSSDRSRFVDEVLAWGRFNVRKGLPFGFDLGTNIGYLANTSYWTLGLEIRWALWEGFRTDVGWIPDLAVRAGVQTMIGEGEFNVTIPSVDVIISEPFVVANSVEITPSIMAQTAFVFVDSELVDLTPDAGAFGSCEPNPTPDPANPGAPPYCTASGADLNHNVVFPSLRTNRFRLGGGLQIRYEWFTLLGTALFDVLEPEELDSSLEGLGLPRQWQVDMGVGVSL